MSKMSRRSFIGFGGICAAGAVLSVAGCTPSGKEAVSSDIEQSLPTTGSPAFLSAPEPVSPDEVVSREAFDIVVVGAGNAGLAAAASALRSGAKVCVVEKSTQANSQGNEGSGIDLDLSDDAAIEFLIDKHLRVNGWRPRRDVVETWARRSGEALKFMVDFTAQCENPLVVNEATEASVVEYPGTDLKATLFWVTPEDGNYAKADPTIADFIASQGADFRYSMPAVQLVFSDEGAVIGVMCQGEDGSYHEFDASKGVILCAGDYQNDEEMTEYYCPDVAKCNKRQNGKTGDGMKMAIWAGGVMEPIGHTKMSHSYGRGPMGDEPFLCLDLQGNRFCSEMADLWEKQTFFRFRDGSAEFVQVFDSTYEDQVKGWGGNPTPLEKLSKYNEESSDWNGSGSLYQADTLEELAEKAGVQDVDAFVASVQRYNELVTLGCDEDYGKPVEYLKEISQPPYYGIFRQCNCTAITSGILTDADQHVIDKEGNPIRGLYAAGNTAGGFFGAIDYQLRAIEGISIGKAMTGGYVAADNAIKGI